MNVLLLVLFVQIPLLIFSQSKTTHTQVLVIGGGVGGTAAAIQSARMGVKTILVEETTMLGGMLTAAGVSCTDGNNELPSGIWEEFRQALQSHYQRRWLNTGWVSWTNFEPHVGDSIFKAWVANEKNLEVRFNNLCIQVLKKGNRLTGAVFTDQRQEISTIKADVIIDATELGDVFAKAGASYDLGMDDPKQSGEKEAREKNNIIQDLTWAAILKDYGTEADKTISRPAGYDEKKYHCCCTDAPCNDKPWNGDKLKMLNYGKLPRSPGASSDKYMLNWPAHGNDIYLNVVEQDWSGRQAAYIHAKQHTLGFIYFMQTVLGMKNIGLAADELNGGMALIPYNREGRRVKGMVRLNVNHIKDRYSFTLYRTGISVGDYPIDHHHGQYPGKVPPLGFPPIPSYNIPMGALIPEKIDGLIVCEKGISVSNIVNGTTRLQPVVLLTGQAAGVLAAKSVKGKRKIRDVPVHNVQEELLKAKCYLMPFVDVKPSDPHWGSMQRVGLTGLIKGVGISAGWANKTFFYPDSVITTSEFSTGLRKYYSSHMITLRSHFRISQLQATIENTFITLQGLKEYFKHEWFRNQKGVDRLNELWHGWGLINYDPARLITRKELAVMLDKCLLLFGNKNHPMDIHGKMYFKTNDY